MTISIDFEVPFAECKKCTNLRPVYEGEMIRETTEDRIAIRLNGKWTCKGYRFCSYLKNEVFGKDG